MSKWADIPAAYGTSGTPTAHPGQGLQFVADDHMKWPLQDLAAAASGAIRTDPYGRALPAAPRLPVCRGLLYFGQTM